MDNPDVELDSVVDMVIPVLDTVESTADAVGYVPLGGRSSAVSYTHLTLPTNREV